jgi:hypothetical protein
MHPVKWAQAQTQCVFFISLHILEECMFNFRKSLVVLAAATLLAQPLFAGSTPRLVPEGSVKILENGVVMDKEMPVPAGSLMACSGQCYVEAGGLQLMGADKTVFALQEEAERFVVMVQEGSLDFALKAGTRTIEFKTPFDTLDAKPYQVPAGTDAVVRGTIQVTKERALLTMTEGSMELTASDGRRLVNAGNTLVLTQTAAEGGAAATSTTVSSTTIVVGAVAVGAVAAGAIALSSGGGDGDGGGNDVSPK